MSDILPALVVTLVAAVIYVGVDKFFAAYESITEMHYLTKEDSGEKE